MADFTDKVVKYGGQHFTNDQEQALDKLTAFYHDPKELEFTLSGKAGTGKTFLIKYFLDKIVHSPVCVSAPTHKAVRTIERATGRTGKTLQSLHGLRPNVNLDDFDLHNVNFDQLGNPTMNNYKLVIIDECSMINDSLHFLNTKRSRDLKTKIIYIGDPNQLPPVSKNDNDTTISSTFNVRNKYELHEIVRQDKDNPLTGLLEVIIDDIRDNTSNFISYLTKTPSNINSVGEGYRVYTDSNMFLTTAIDCFKDDKFSNDPDYGRIAAWKNDTVLLYNMAVRNKLIPHFSGPETLDVDGSVKELIDINDLLIGYKTITDEHNDTVIINSEDYVVEKVVPRNSEGVFKSYGVKLRPRHGGKVIDVNIVDYRDKSFMVFYEIIKQKYFNAKYGGANKSTMWRKYFDYKDNHLTIYPFPIKTGDGKVVTYVGKDLDYAFSLTTHKLQGSTIQNTFVDLNDMLYYKTGRIVADSDFAPRATEMRNKLIYTAISRTSKVCNIYLNLVK